MTKRQRMEDGIYLNDPNAYISLREDTVKEVCGILEKNNIILISSPPYSGKTSLAILLENHFKKKKSPEEEVIRITFLSVADEVQYPTFEDFWKKTTGKSWSEWLNRKHPTTIIIDEGQNGYTKNFSKAATFWNQLKLMCEERESFNHIRVIVFSSYGQRWVGTEFSTPFGFPESYGALLLFCNKKEAQELVDAFNKKNEAKIKVSLEVSEAIFKLTEGHIGMISLTLGAIEDKFKYIAGPDPNVVTDTLIYRYLNSYDFIVKILNHRAAPSLIQLTKDERSFLEQLLLNKKERLIGVDKKDLAYSLIKRNLIRFVDEDQSKMFAIGSEEVCFISSLIELVCFHELLTAKRAEVTPTSLENCVLKILSLFKPSFLKNSKGFGTEKKLNERSWQMEFYRVATSVLPSNHHISADLQRINITDISDGEELEGALDFYINDGLEWAIELLREGDRMKQHSDRFTKGNYLKLNPKDYVLLDFRNHNKKPAEFYKNMWFVLYKDDYSGAIIKREGKEDLEIEFHGDLITSMPISYKPTVPSKIWMQYGDNKDKIDLSEIEDVADLRKTIITIFKFDVSPLDIKLYKGGIELPPNKLIHEVVDGVDYKHPILVKIKGDDKMKV